MAAGYPVGEGIVTHVYVIVFEVQDVTQDAVTEVPVARETAAAATSTVAPATHRRQANMSAVPRSALKIRRS
jgi:hypothetical protein